MPRKGPTVYPIPAILRKRTGSVGNGWGCVYVFAPPIESVPFVCDPNVTGSTFGSDT